MIHVKFHIQTKDVVKTKKIQFCKNHEKDLEIIYKITKETIGKKEKCGIEELMIICCFLITKEIRENKITEIIQNKLFAKLSKHQSVIQILRDIKKISIEAKIDNFQKKTIEYTPKPKDFGPILVKL